MPQAKHRTRFHPPTHTHTRTTMVLPSARNRAHAQMAWSTTAAPLLDGLLREVAVLGRSRHKLSTLTFCDVRKPMNRSQRMSGVHGESRVSPGKGSEDAVVLLPCKPASNGDRTRRRHSRSSQEGVEEEEEIEMTPKTFRNPRVPTQDEVDEREAAHLPHRSRCPTCMAGR